MRRLLVAATVVTALLAVGGCSGDGTPSTAPTPAGPTSASAGSGGSPAASSSPASPGGLAGGNAGAVCAAVTRASSDSATRFIAALGRMLESSTAKDQAAADAARRDAQAALTAWSTAMKEQSARASDARLKAALADVGREVAKIKPDVASINQTQLNDLQQRIDQLCGS
jgi:hypothetical protein